MRNEYGCMAILHQGEEQEKFKQRNLYRVIRTHTLVYG